MTDYHIRSNCRLCGHDRLDHAIKLSPTPLANELLNNSDKSKNQEKFPLYLVRCDKCSHVQLPVVVDPERLFRDYVYVSGTSPVFVKHFESYANAVINKFKIGHDSLVVDIGSNDGTLLKFFKASGAKILGIDPARDIASEATRNGILTLPEFFSSDLAISVADTYGKASVITANNVFAHIDNLHDIISGVKELLTPDGVFVFEVSYLVDVLKNLLFDTIYHEHLSYHTVSALIPFFKVHGMRLFDVDFIGTHGGSIRCYVDLGVHPTTKNVGIAESMEKSIRFSEFESKIIDLGVKLTTKLDELKIKNKIVIGYGAPAKATTLVHQFGLTSDHIKCVIDDSPLKQGKFIPGTDIPIISSVGAGSFNPDYMLILAWNFADSIIQKNESFRQNGGKFIIPIPEFKEC
jgi:SAM-dependent methyltransferase